jgi:hypothetical protein
MIARHTETTERKKKHRADDRVTEGQRASLTEGQWCGKELKLAM